MSRVAEATYDIAAKPAGKASIDAASLMRIKQLPLRARVVVEGFFNGLHRSPFYGFSSEFSEYRQYSLGDDPKHIDWRLFARSDRLFVKRFEDETNRRVSLVVDQSRSMSYGSLGYTKSDYTRTLAATFGYYLTLQRDCVGLLTYDESIRDYLPARHRPGHLRQLMGLLENIEQGNSTEIAHALEQVSILVKKRGLVVVMSDFLAPAETLKRPLAYLRSRGHEVWALRILDPREVDFNFDQANNFADAEDERLLFIDPAAARPEYLKNFQTHEKQLGDICGQLGIELTTLTTDAPLDRALFAWIARQAQQTGIADRRNVGQGGWTG